ncbi:MAG: hypothetical protein DM484_30930 [Candidatus Methylumidiphilus alinenensis]|uniref:Tetratricopeptide repeat protein n=1 Tax=Candidatus Methylumidiphilus alinenensis TaxID=2202197 RepID=A0A2W4QDS4_9GAMM|nr:MAG: hypothetical protein DM484_30930 [Candidatus Methylumidiphilus alinenensis]
MTNSYSKKLTLVLLAFNANLAMAHEGIGAHLDHINEALQKNPDKQSLYIERGAIYSSEAGLYEQALKDFSNAEKLGPPIVVAYEFGLLFFRMNQFEKAISYFDTYIKRFPEYAPPYEYRAKAAYQLGNIEQSLADFNTFFQLEKQANPGSFITAAGIQASVKDAKGLDAAIALLDRGIAQIGLNPQLQYYAIQLELRRNRPDQAISRLDSIKTLLNESPSWKLDMAELLFKTGETKQALKLLNDSEAQLKMLKATPARINLIKEIQTLRHQYDLKR